MDSDEDISMDVDSESLPIPTKSKGKGKAVETPETSMDELFHDVDMSSDGSEVES